MSDSIFINATEARRRSRDSVIILNEVRALEANVLANISAGSLQLLQSTGTTMTGNTSYYQAYNGITTNTTITDQINMVKKHFKGYSVNISTNASTGNTIQWTIKW